MSTPAQPQPSRPATDYPVVLRVGGWECLVVGGGPVAAGKIRRLLAAGARVTVVAPEVSSAIATLAAQPGLGQEPPSVTAAEASLAIECRCYQAGEAGRYQLVVTATGRSEVDRAVVADAVAAGVLVNSADSDAPGTIQLPAVHRHGPVTVAVSTGGTSPALARWLRDRMAESIPDGVATIGALLDEARLAMRAAGVPTESVEWMAVLDRMAPLVSAGRIDEARAALFEVCLPHRSG